MYSYGPLHMDEQRQDDQLEPTYSTGCSPEDLPELRRVARKGQEYLCWWRHHDDDDLTLMTCTEWSQPVLHSPGLEPVWHNTTKYIYGHYLTRMTCTEWSQPGLDRPRLEPLWHNISEYINGVSLDCIVLTVTAGSNLIVVLQ